MDAAAADAAYIPAIADTVVDTTPATSYVRD
jgi:hypothetical protein